MPEDAVAVPWQVFALVYLGLTGLWLGAMGYSLAVVQPKVTRFFTDDRRREELLTVLAHGNRWPVVALATGMTAAGTGAVAAAPGAGLVVGYAVALGLHLTASAIFVEVSWRHWPARVFALPEELPGFRRRLRVRAWAMLGLIGGAFLAALAGSVWT